MSADGADETDDGEHGSMPTSARSALTSAARPTLCSLPVRPFRAPSDYSALASLVCTSTRCTDPSCRMAVVVLFAPSVFRPFFAENGWDGGVT